MSVYDEYMKNKGDGETGGEAKPEAGKEGAEETKA